MGSEGYIAIDKDAVLHKGKTSEVIKVPQWEVSGIPQGVRDLIQALDSGGEVASPGHATRNVVEVILASLSRKSGAMRRSIYLCLANNAKAKTRPHDELD